MMDKQAPQGNRINIKITNQKEGLCKTGVPFPKGRINTLNQLKLSQNNNDVACFGHSLNYWPDDSIKWANIGFFHSANTASQYELLISDSAMAIPKQGNSDFQLTNNEKELTIVTGKIQFSLNLETLLLSAKSNSNTQELAQISSLGGSLSLSKDKPEIARLEHWNSRTLQNLNNSENELIELELEGYFDYPTDKQRLRFKTLIEFYRLIPSIKITISLHNPNAAKHPCGIWDLGDEGSTLFESFTLDLTLTKENNVSYQIAPGEKWQPTESNIAITQHGSGGKNWQSPVHLDRNNQITPTINGFEVSVKQSTISHGDRATPSLHSAKGVGLTIEQFWQNFPSAIETRDQDVRLGLFPSISGTTYELQGGERKTHTVWLTFSDQANDLNWVHTPPIVKVDPNWLTECNALPTFLNTTTDPVKELIKAGLEHEKNFFTKRETIDEYGWRNFGELYADHETWRHTGDGLFPSHYNNQYDPIYGFLRQFLLSGDPRWYELADDLAKHVKDIDIYHTNEDKAEYNNGLFWHTDHYLKAYTATHRTFSKFQAKDNDEGDRIGGGPGGQHCYTTGLTYHYLLTGSEDSKLTVLSMAKWITALYEGTDTCLELLLAIKNRNALAGRNPFSKQYPFDRGTANYAVALLDCYQLTQEQSYLHRVEDIIHNTIHPADNIEAHDLSNIEEHWFYTVFLQAVCRYLEIKETTETLDEAFYYARDALLHYADWMLINEYPYREKPELLQFPNETWTGQDLRKTHIFAAASYYSPENKQVYLDKAKYFQTYVTTRLSTSTELSYTRILVLLMQNHGPLEYYEAQHKTTDFDKRQQVWPKARYQQPSTLIIGITTALAKRLFKLSITNEISWLKKRLGK